MNVKEIKPTGMFKAWKNSVFEVTAAKEEKENFVDPRQVADLTAKTVQTLNLAADENISPKEFLSDRTPDILSGHHTNAPELHAKDGLEKRLENLSNILEKQLSAEENRQKEVKERFTHAHLLRRAGGTEQDEPGGQSSRDGDAAHGLPVRRRSGRLAVYKNALQDIAGK